MLGSLISTLLAEALLLLIGGAAALMTRRWSNGSRTAQVAFALIGIGLASMLGFVVTWQVPRALGPLALVVVSLAFGYVVVKRAWRWWRLILPTAVLTVGVTMAYLGLFYLWRSGLFTFDLAPLRFTATNHVLPIDNWLPVFFANFIEAGKSTHLFVGTWNGGDRPPLLSGTILLLRPVIEATGVQWQSASFGVAVAMQLTWIPAVYALVRCLGFSRSAARIAVAASAVLGTTLLNSVYTWPKMTSAAMVLTSIALLLLSRRSSHPRILLGGALVAFVLGALCHGAAAFGLPAMIVFGVFVWRGERLRRLARHLLPGAIAAVVVYVPWAMYQRFADPPGDRLLKWHLAGDMNPDHNSFLQDLIHKYSILTFSTWLDGRWRNLATVFSGPFSYYWPNKVGIEHKRSDEFYITGFALGLWYPMILAIAIVVIIRAVLRKWDHNDTVFAVLIGSSLLSILVWCILMYIPGSTVVHQGSQVWIFLMAIAPVLWLWQRVKWLAVALVAVQGTITAVYYVPFPRPEPLSPSSLVVMIVGLVVTIVALVSDRPQVRRFADRLVSTNRRVLLRIVPTLSSST